MICLISLILLTRFIMQTLESTSIAQRVVEILLDNLKQYLQEEQQRDEMIGRLREYSMFCVHGCGDVYTLRGEAINQNVIEEEELNRVPHLSKDTLMPKEITNEQSAIQNQNKSTLTITNMGHKKVSSLSTKYALSLSSRPSSLLAKSQRYQKSKESNKEKQNSYCQQLKSQAEIDDPEIAKLRERTEIRLHYDSQYRKLQINHQKSYKAKSEVMTSFIQEEPSSILTHDYDGEQMKSIQGDDKIKHYTLKMGIGASKIASKDNKRTLQPLQSEILLQRNTKQRQMYRNLRQMEMPLFQQPKLQAKILSGIESYRLNEYKKHFGRGYSRLDNLNKTIEYSNTKEQEDIFTEKKHLVDTLQTSGVFSSTLQNSRVSRRLALPKLHGRYKVLDRYEQE